MPVEYRGFTASQTEGAISAQVKAFVVRSFESVLREEVGRGFDNEPVVSTDGWLRRDYRDVKPFGRIEARPRAQLGDAVQWLLAELRRLSPVLTGRYRDSHQVWIDGTPATIADLDTAGGRRVMVVNTQPYAGKIEGKDAYTRYELKGGKRSRRAKRYAAGFNVRQLQGQSRQAPSGVYRVAIANFQKRFGRTIVALYQPQALPLGYTVKARGRPKGRAQIYPAIVLGVLQ